MLCCAGNIILFVDEAHILAQYSAVGHGNKGSGLDIANLFKPSLGRGQLQVRICSLSFLYSCILQGIVTGLVLIISSLRIVTPKRVVQWE